MSVPRAASRTERVYRALLRAYPADVRRDHGDMMADHVRDWHRDVRARSGAAGVAWLWARLLPDLLVTAAHARLARRRAPHGDRMLDTLANDIRHAARMARKNALLSAAAVLLVALGTGAVSTIFSVANAVALRPLPGVDDASGLVAVTRTRPDGGGSLSASYPYVQALSRGRRMRVAAWSMLPLTASTGGQGVSALGNIVSDDYFRVLGVRPALGRFFTPDETRPGKGAPVVVVSHAFWRRELGGDRSALGRTLFVNGAPLTVIGVAPPRFSGVYPMLRTDVWVSLALQPLLRPGLQLESPRAAWLDVFARLAPGASRADAEAEAAALTRRYATAPGSPEDAHMAAYAGARVSRAAGLPAEVAGAVLGFFVVLIAVSALVLLIASVNVAGMLLARTVARRREVAMRLALGAGRGRIARQLVTENVLLFALGGAGGVALAEWGTRWLGRVDLPVDVPLTLDVTPDARVLACTLIVSLLTGVAVAVAPALRATRADPSAGLRGDDARSGRARSRGRDALVIAQVAASLVLLSASGLFLRALDRGRRVDPGFDVTHVATTAIDVGTAGYDEARGRALYRALRERLAAEPGVEAVAYARVLPLSMNVSGTDASVPGYAPPGGAPGDAFPVLTDEVDAGYLAATRLPLVAGRGITDGDDERATMVALVNETFARRTWPGQVAVGRTMKLDGRDVAVVGVVRDAKFGRLDEAPAPFVYLPLAQHWHAGVNLLVRTQGDPRQAYGAIRRALATLDPKLPAPTLTTLERSVSVALLPQRFAVAVTGALGVVGLLLAAIGLYGVLSFSAAQRTREMGVRLALGARRADVVRLVVGEGGRLIGVGMVVGAALALAAARALTPFLFGVDPADPVTFVGIGVVLAGVAFVACWVPARRAASVDPVTSLRQS